jgi:transcriptional regulator with XRE-family HTH domain
MDEAGRLDRDQSGSIWARAVSQILEDARRRAGKGPALASRLEQAGVMGRGARYSESSISNWIRGRAMPPADVVLAAAKALGISLDERLGIGREPSDGDRQLAEMRELLARQEERSAAFEERLEDVVRAVTAAKSSADADDVESRLARIEVQVMELQEDLTEREPRAGSQRRSRSNRSETDRAK